MTYRRRASPLHAARALVGAAWCLSLVIVALAAGHPVVVGGVLAATLAAARGARVARTVWRACVWALPFGLLIAAVNAAVTREGLTVIMQVGPVPGFGVVDVTLEAVAAGAVFGLTAMALMAIAALYSAAVDPDDLLRGLRRVSFRGALTAALATRMVPVLARDARRMADAQRCGGAEPASRLTVVRAVAAGALDRAVDVAATLEVRGYGRARTGARPGGLRRPWSRHDAAFAASAAGLLVVAVVVRAAGLAPLDAYPRFRAPIDASVIGAAVAVAVVALLPFADRRGIGP